MSAQQVRTDPGLNPTGPAPSTKAPLLATPYKGAGTFCSACDRKFIVRGVVARRQGTPNDGTAPHYVFCMRCAGAISRAHARAGGRR